MKFLPAKFVGAFVLCGLFMIGHAQEQTFASPDIPVREIQVAAESFFRGDKPPSWVEATDVPTTSRKNSAVLRLWDTQFRAGSAPVYYVNRALQINDSTALAWAGQLTMDFVPQYQKLHLHSVRILRGNEVLDKTQVGQVRFLQRELGMEQGVYSGSVNAVMLVTDLRVGDTLQYAYSIEGDNPVFAGVYSQMAGWDNTLPVELRNVTLSHPVQQRVDWKMLSDVGGTDIRPEVSESAGWRKLKFLQRGRDAIEPEPAIPHDFIAYRQLQFSSYDSWNSVARWANDLFPAEQIPAQMQPLIDTWNQLPDAEKKAMAALHWVQQEIRYFSVSMGESSHRPRRPSEVVRDRFGDCKDKTYLLVTLLRSMGLDATPMLTSASAATIPTKMLPTPLAFDHILVRLHLDGNDYYLDPTLTGQSNRLATLGMMTEGAAVLAVSDTTQRLSSMHWPEALARNVIQLDESLTLPAFDADGTLTANWIWSGSDAEYMRVGLRNVSADQLKKFALGNYERRYPGIDLAGVPTVSDDLENNRYTVTSKFIVPKPAKEFSDGWVVKYVAGNLVGLYSLPKNLKRSFPALVTRAPYRMKYKMDIHWPAKVAVIRDPASKRVRNAFFDASVSLSFRGNVSQTEINIDLLADTATGDQLIELAREVQRLNTTLPTADYVERTSIKGSGLLGIGTTTLRETIQTRLRAEITAYNRAISSGRLTGADLVEALCRRAETWADLQEPAKGLPDADEAVRKGPALSRAWECRGHLLRDNGDFSKSISDYTKALTLGETGGSVFQARGISRFYLGNYSEAQVDFLQSYAAAPGGSDAVPYALLWHGLASQRLGQPPAPELLALMPSVDARSAWPKPLLGLVTGKLGERDILQAAESKQGDDKDMALTEAWFFVGQHRLANGDVNGGVEAFEQARKLGVSIYMEHMAAGWELARLKKNGAQ